MVREHVEESSCRASLAGPTQPPCRPLQGDPTAIVGGCTGEPYIAHGCIKHQTGCSICPIYARSNLPPPGCWLHSGSAGRFAYICLRTARSRCPPPPSVCFVRLHARRAHRAMVHVATCVLLATLYLDYYQSGEIPIISTLTIVETS